MKTLLLAASKGTNLPLPTEEHCDDSRSSVHLGAPEICGDGIDQDCSSADLPCACSPGEKAPCFTGIPGTAGVRTCTNHGTWGACTGVRLEEPVLRSCCGCGALVPIGGTRLCAASACSACLDIVCVCPSH